MFGLLYAADSWITQFCRSFLSHIVEELKVGDIGEKINEEIMQIQYFFSVKDFKMVLTDSIVVTWVALFIVLILCLWCASGSALRPTKRQTVMELVLGLVLSTCKGFGMNEKEAKAVSPMIISMGFMITACNMISYAELPPPAKNIAFPVAMGLFAIIYVIVMSVKFVGFKGLWASLTEPMSFMLPFKILDMLIKPVSLALRLFGNVFGAFVFMKFLYIIFPIGITATFGLWFDLADGLLQAVVFTYLTMSYIGEIVEVGHELQEEHEHSEQKSVEVSA
ncbi:MAG: F0F1 ATP synthase subunit A [Clostridia bacterium]|nr:F0F1 ATP synthase subunit A [Clostridia bacterium]